MAQIHFFHHDDPPTTCEFPTTPIKPSSFCLAPSAASSEKVSVSLAPDKLPTEDYDFAVSASEIIKELPKLSEAERRAVLKKLRELAAQDEDVRLCDQAATEQAAKLDR